MRNLHRGLLQEKALLWIVSIDPRLFVAGGFLGQHLENAAFHDPLVIFLGVNSIGGEFKAGPAFDAAVTAGSVAAAPRENVDDITGKTKRALLIGVFDLERSARGEGADAGG